MSKKSTAKRLANTKVRAVVKGIGDKWNDWANQKLTSGKLTNGKPLVCPL